jgi:molecular chaperone GrpE (heat shock protein)
MKKTKELLLESEEKYLRLYSDFENYKRRTLKEKEDLVSKTKTEMLSSILDIDSDITIAIKNINDEETRYGVTLILKKIEMFLKNNDIEPIQTDVYDKDLHDVVSIIELGYPKIVDVITKGYTLNGKPIRFPKIILSK